MIDPSRFLRCGVLLCASFAPATCVSQALPARRCGAISEGVLTEGEAFRAGGIYLPKALDVLLTADVPVGGHFVSLVLEAKDVNIGGGGALIREGGAWTTCTPDARCQSAIFRKKSLTENGGDWVDGSRHIGAIAESLFANANGARKDTYVRLTVTYDTEQPFCTAQQSWQVRRNENAPMGLLVPESKTILGFDSFATEVRPRTPNWYKCEAWTPPNPLNIQHSCVEGNPGKIGFIQSAIDEFGGVVPFERARGFQNICSNDHGELSRACRVVVRYK